MYVGDSLVCDDGVVGSYWIHPNETSANNAFSTLNLLQNDAVLVVVVILGPLSLLSSLPVIR